MIYKAIYGGKEVNLVTNICIGDIVSVEDYGYAYLYYRHAYYMVWGYDVKLLSDKGWSYTRNILTKSNEWKVVGFIAHEFSKNGILVGLQDRKFNRIIVELKAVTLLRKKIKDDDSTVIVEPIRFAESSEPWEKFKNTTSF